MARLEFDKDDEVGDIFCRIGRCNRVGRKHNHQPRGRARDKKAVARQDDKMKKKLARFHELVAAYWRGEIDAFPKEPK